MDDLGRLSGRVFQLALLYAGIWVCVLFLALFCTWILVSDGPLLKVAIFAGLAFSAFHFGSRTKPVASLRLGGLMAVLLSILHAGRRRD